MATNKIYAARICFNSSGWRRPTGEAGLLESGSSYTSFYRFGMEEWLFQNDWEIDGWRYAFLQGVNRSLARLNNEGAAFDVLLYTVVPDKSAKINRRRLVALIRNVESLTEKESEVALKSFKAKGWYRQMEQDIDAVDGRPEGLKGTLSRGAILNIRFRSENVVMYPPDTFVAQNHLIHTLTRYYLVALGPAQLATLPRVSSPSRANLSLPSGRGQGAQQAKNRARTNSPPETYLLTWNPERWEWTELQDDLRAYARKGHLDCRWSCGNTKKIKKGDRFFLIKLGKEPRGIIGSGVILLKPDRGDSWDVKKPGATSWSIPVRFNTLVDPRAAVLRHSLLKKRFPQQNWSPQASGISINPDIAIRLEALWAEFIGTPDELPLGDGEDAGTFLEGALKMSSGMAFERNGRARKACIRKHGWDCAVCGLNFSERYGLVGEKFIHVHHLRELRAIRKEYELDAITDLRPVCPNCHAMLHRRVPAYSIDELKQMMEAVMPYPDRKKSR